jgi:hypothetical protein
MPIDMKAEWENYEKSNVDPYGKCCVDVAREVMRNLDEGGPIDCHKMICDADKKINAGGITGFMAGCVAQMVGECHSRGEEFRKSWNSGYGCDEDKAKGRTVNPAILTINTGKI